MKTPHLIYVLAVSLLVVSCGSDKSTNSDSIPPGAVTDLAVSAVSDSSVTLTWTATGDDDTTGTAATYDIRFSTSTVNESNWDNAITVSGEPTPKAAGSTETMEVIVTDDALAAALGNAETDTTYHFALKTADEAGNWSVLSNEVSTILLDEVAPAAITDLAVTGTTDSSITLIWTAPGNNGSVGTAATYDIRFRTAIVTEANWSGATQIDGAPTPQIAGTTETFEAVVASGAQSLTLAVDVEAGFTYYVGIKTADASDNWSPLSNVVNTQLADLTPPAPVEDLYVESFTATSVTLRWNAPGDNGNEGTAAAYDLRYSTSMITDTNWDAATTVVGLPEPNSAGSLESFEVTGFATGIRVYFAIKTRDASNNWSSLSNVISSTPLNNTVVTFPDANLESVIRTTINKPTGDIMSLDLLTVINLSSISQGITDLTGIEHCINLTNLNIQSNQVSDLSPLTPLTLISTLILYNNEIIDISPLANMTNLDMLSTGKNQIVDLTPLTGLTKLTYLKASENDISNLTGLENLTKLTFLDLALNSISDLSPLVGLTSLEKLRLNSNGIADVSPLAGLTALEELNISRNQITGISDLSGLANLRELQIGENQITSLVGVEGMTQLSEISAHENQIADLTPLSGLTQLTKVWLYRNSLTDISAISGLTNLEQMSLFSNSVTDLSPLAGMTKMKRLFLYNNGLSDISPLAGMTEITEIDMTTNNISDVSIVTNWKKAEIIGLRDNNISDLSGLAGATAVSVLRLSENPIVDITELTGLTNLSNLYLSETDVVDLAPLVNNTGLGTGDNLWIEKCTSLSAISTGTHIPALEARGVTVYK